MTDLLKKEKKKQEEDLIRIKDLSEKIESMKCDITSKIEIIKGLKTEREKKIANIKKIEIENETNCEKFIAEYENVLSQYKNIEKRMYEILEELKTMSEKSYNELLELRNEKNKICQQKDNIIEEKQKEYADILKKMQLDKTEHSIMINKVLTRIQEIFKKTHIEYETEEDLKPLIIRLQNVHEEAN